MLTDIQAKLAAFTNTAFQFDEAAHAYTLDGQPLTSWTRWIETYTNPFPEQEAARAAASKRGTTPEVILAEWDWSRELGTLVHAFIEWYLAAKYSSAGEAFVSEQVENRLFEAHPDVAHRCRKFLAIHAARLHTITPLAMELQAHHGPAGVAGTLDFIGHHPKRAGVLILDWKSNSKFDCNNQITRFTKRFRGPLADLYETKQNLYSLQNSFYRVLLEEAGIPTGPGALIWLPPGDAPAEVIPAIDYRARLRSLLFN